MKKILIIISMFILVGCTNKNQAKEFKNKLDKANKYYIEGKLELLNDENKSTFNITVSKDKNNYKVDFLNTINNYEQIILKNNSGTYVISPKLNKSYKFGSNWPDDDNTKVYILESLMKEIDIKKYKKNKIEDNKKIIYFNNNKIEKAEIKDDSGIVRIRMNYKDIDFTPEFDKDYFKLDSIRTNKVEETSKKIDNVVYPLYMPLNTYLKNTETLEDGNRTILTFQGEKPFTIIEEAVNITDNLEIKNMNGKIVMIDDKIGSQDNDSVTWLDENTEYFATSKELDKEELLEVAKSMGSVPLTK